MEEGVAWQLFGRKETGGSEEEEEAAWAEDAEEEAHVLARCRLRCSWVGVGTAAAASWRGCSGLAAELRCGLTTCVGGAAGCFA